MTHRPIVARTSSRSTVIEVRDRLYLRLDAEGRWTAFGEGAALFRRTVDGNVVCPADPGFETLTPAEADTVCDWVVRRAGELVEALAEAPEGTVEWIGDRRRLEDCLAIAACASGEDRMARRALAEAAYPEPPPILPPHRYRDIVVLPATGCPNHRCTFCAFYQDVPFRVFDRAVFQAHLEAVGRLFGAALAERDGIFLGSASALSIPDDRLHPRLEDIARVLGKPRRGIASFHDPDRSPARRPSDWAALGEAGLTEATLGLETGHAELRRSIGKSADLDRFGRTVGSQKTGGLRLSLTVLVGLGGEAAADAHRQATIDVVSRLPLDAGDRVYVSPLRGAFGGEAALAEEIGRWRADLGGQTAARIGEYRIERFAWLA